MAENVKKNISSKFLGCNNCICRFLSLTLFDWKHWLDSWKDQIVRRASRQSDRQSGQIHCGTFKHVGGHKLLKACPFFVSWQIKKSKLPKDYLHRKGSLGGCGQFFPPPPPPQNCPLSTKINFWHCSGWKKNCPQVEFNAQ